MALVYSAASKRNITNAVNKAKQVKPLVKPVAGSIGLFDVKGSEGEFYRVEFSKNAAGELVVTCGCKGNKKSAACYHAAACSHIFKKQVADRAAEKAAQHQGEHELEPTPGAVDSVPGSVEFDGAATLVICGCGEVASPKTFKCPSCDRAELFGAVA